MGNLWGLHNLVPHPAHLPLAVERVTGQILGWDTNALLVEFAVCPVESVVLPMPAAPTRTDGLWRTTCFEAFLKNKGAQPYLEYNFSPSSAWAAYAFDNYRAGMRPLAIAVDPEIMISEGGTRYYHLSAEFDVVASLPESPHLLNLAAVVEEASGHKSYWALAHPPGAPDFHHPDCFALELPPPAAP